MLFTAEPRNHKAYTMNSKHSLLLMTSVAAGCLLSACNATMSNLPPTYAGCKTWDQQTGTASSVATTVMSADLAKMIGVQDVLTDRNTTGLATVQATVYNCSDVDVLLNMRTRFNGTTGQSEAPSAWKNVFLAPRGQAAYSESALSRSTTKVSIDINDGNRPQMQFAPGQSFATPPK